MEHHSSVVKNHRGRSPAMRIWMLAAIIMLAGCTAPDLSDDPAPTSTSTGTSTGTAPSTGEVTYKQEGDQWIAMRTDAYDGDFQARADGDISTPAGAIIIKTGDYGMINHLTARGDSKEAARQSLESIRVDHASGDTIRIASSAPDWSDKTSSYTVTVPGAWNDLTTSAAAGAIQLQAQTIDDWSVGQAAGGITAALTTARSIQIAGAAGGIVFADVSAIDMDIHISSGAVVLEMATPPGSGMWDVTNTAGLIELSLDSGWYDVSATSDVGSVDIDMPGEDVEGPGCAQNYGSYACVGEHHRKRSHGFSAADVQTTMTLHATSGSVYVDQ